LLHAGFLITLLYELQDGDVLLRNVGWLPPDYTMTSRYKATAMP
jgi:hypothetical protein